MRLVEGVMNGANRGHSVRMLVLFGQPSNRARKERLVAHTVEGSARP